MKSTKKFAGDSDRGPKLIMINLSAYEREGVFLPRSLGWSDTFNWRRTGQRFGRTSMKHCICVLKRIFPWRGGLKCVFRISTQFSFTDCSSNPICWTRWFCWRPFRFPLERQVSFGMFQSLLPSSCWKQSGNTQCQDLSIYALLEFPGMNVYARGCWQWKTLANRSHPWKVCIQTR